MSRIALILPSNIYFSPYLSIYSDLLVKNGISFDLLYWDREGRSESFKNAISYNKACPLSSNPINKFLGYYKFCQFIKRNIKKNKYDKLIIFGSQVPVFLASYLLNNYRGKYVVDFRDLGIEQKFMSRFKKALKGSAINVVSSMGFLSFLPKEFRYILSHNFNIELVRKALNEAPTFTMKETVEVLTIGGIRDFEQNAEIISALANDNRFFIHFVGKGIDKERLESYAKENHVENIRFDGFYEKKEEGKYIEEATFLNIYYPRKPSHDSAISNRFYNSLIYCKPMITTADTVQGNYASKYRLGLAINDTIDLKSKLIKFHSDLKIEDYVENRKTLLESFIEDYNKWESSILNFIQS